MPDEPVITPHAGEVPIQYAQTVPFLGTARNGWVRISAIEWVGYDPNHGTRTCIAVTGQPQRVPVLGTLEEVMAICGFSKALVATPQPLPAIKDDRPVVTPQAEPNPAHGPISSKLPMDKQGS